MVRTLVHSYGLPAPLPAAAEVAEGLARGGVFRRGVLVGAIAFQTYAAMLGMRLPGSLVKSYDDDGAQLLRVSIAIRDNSDSIAEVLQSVDPTFREMTSPHRYPAKQYMSSRQLRVDILVPNQCPDSQEPPYHASQCSGDETVQLLDFLIHEPVKAVLLHGSGILITVPAPARFSAYKLILSSRRESTQAKSNEDLRQAAMLFQMLLQKRPEDLKRVWGDAMQRGPAWQELLVAGVSQLPTSVQKNLKACGVIPGRKGANG
jgi:hypothetical protein